MTKPRGGSQNQCQVDASPIVGPSFEFGPRLPTGSPLHGGARGAGWVEGGVAGGRGIELESSWNANLNLTRTLGTDRWTGSASLQALAPSSQTGSTPITTACPMQSCTATSKGSGGIEGQRGCLMNGSEVAGSPRSDVVAFGIVRVRFVVGGGRPCGICPELDHQLEGRSIAVDVGLEPHSPNRWPHGHPVLQRVFQRRQRALRAHARFGEPVLCGCRRRQTHPFSWGSVNVTDATQQNPLLGTEDPFGEDFDASRVYGP